MPTFDPNNPRSAGGAALYHTSLRLSECASFQRMSETATSSAALEKIILGASGVRPWDDHKFTREQLEGMFCEGHLYPPDEDENAVTSADGRVSEPLEAGQFWLTVKRIARESEIPDQAARNELYLWWFDECEALRRELMRLSMAAECPRLRHVRRAGAPAFSSREASVGSGVTYLWCEFVVTWGDAIGS